MASHTRYETRFESHHAHPRRVDFFSHLTDYQCFFLASMGMTTAYISAKTDLTMSQVMYRLQLAEKRQRIAAQGHGKRHITVRQAFRNGASPVAHTLLQHFTPRGDNAINRHLNKRLTQNGLFAPRPKGVMK